ncbi:hypothetical protein BX666DRAFT_1128380 [Dichotomocladium elegans]|nr:hypothetical protein BX666DRAFT_1128380 [Dichotomocladium elegans]
MPTTTITAASLADNHHRSYHPLPTRDSRLLVLAKQRQRASSLNDAAPDAFRREIYLERIASPSRAQQLRSPQQQRRASIQPLMPLHATNIVPRRVAKCTACPSSPSPDEPGASTMHKASAISLPAAAAVATTHLTAATTLLAAVVMTTADHDRQDKEREEKWGHLTTTCLAQSKRVEKMAHELVTGDHHDETCVKELLRTQSEILTKLESLMVGPAPAVAEMDLPEETIQDTSSPTPGVEEDKTDNNTIIQPEMRRSQWWSISGASVDGKVIRRGADGKIMISGMGQTTEISLIPKVNFLDLLLSDTHADGTLWIGSPSSWHTLAPSPVRVYHICYRSALSVSLCASNRARGSLSTV